MVSKAGRRAPRGVPPLQHYFEAPNGFAFFWTYSDHDSHAFICVWLSEFRFVWIAPRDACQKSCSFDWASGTVVAFDASIAFFSNSAPVLLLCSTSFIDSSIRFCVAGSASFTIDCICFR